ncbi:MAG: AmmeMemoRadiSam system protein B [Chlorobi bacterium]|nr:AmmeMemoRadiSam system protein B [Chlorobiota bacterium]
MKIRKPFVAGKFYPSDKNELKNLISKIRETELDLIKLNLSENKIIGGIVPHAGYVYSAYQAIHFFEILRASKQKFDTFIIINPDHNGYGNEINLDTNDAWQTPLGTVETDTEITELLNFERSEEAHKYEHSGEVILPLLQYFTDYDFKIVPITVSNQNYYNAQIIANNINSAKLKTNRKICILASTDFSHYVNPEYGKKQDTKAFNEIFNFNAEQLIKTVKQEKISMCGYGPVAGLLEYAKIVSEKPEIKLLKYGNSGEAYPSDKVVDYASFLIYE